jgi:ABC-type uncharacterized transport system permease subunit
MTIFVGEYFLKLWTRLGRDTETRDRHVLVKNQYVILTVSAGCWIVIDAVTAIILYLFSPDGG